jgi:hypothetical protein
MIRAWRGRGDRVGEVTGQKAILINPLKNALEELRCENFVLGYSKYNILPANYVNSEEL